MANYDDNFIRENHVDFLDWRSLVKGATPLSEDEI